MGKDNEGPLDGGRPAGGKRGGGVRDRGKHFSDHFDMQGRVKLRKAQGGGEESARIENEWASVCGLV